MHRARNARHPRARQGRSEAAGADDEAGWSRPAAATAQRDRARVARAGTIYGVGDRPLGQEADRRLAIVKIYVDISWQTFKNVSLNR